jgi:hypothetical protein
MTAIERARAAYSAIAAAEAAVQVERNKLANIIQTQQQEQHERERLREEEDHDAAVRVVNGDDAAPRKPRRVSRLAKLDEAIPAYAGAIQIQRAKIAELERSPAAAKPPLVAAILDVVEEVQGNAVEEIRSTLVALREPMARLIAADQIRAATIGERFPVERGRATPFSGLTVIRNFAKAVPERLAPDELKEAGLLDAAHALSSGILLKIKES